MERHGYSWFVTFLLFVFALQPTALTVAGQVRPGGVRVPGTTPAREAPLVNWADVTTAEFTLGGGPLGSFHPFQLLSLESVGGSQHWVVRSYHWDASGPVLDGTEVYPNGARVVHAVTGYTSNPFGGGGGGGWPHKYPIVTIAILVPIPSQGTGVAARRVGPLSTRTNPAALYRIPVAQAIGYKLMSTAPAAGTANPGVCSHSTKYSSSGPPLQASCILLEPGQSVDLPNQIRILRVGNDYRIMVGGSLVEDLTSVTIVRSGNRYYTLRILRP